MDNNPLVRRADAAQATLDRFKDKPFQWGTRDCARMVAAHLRSLGYKVKLPPSGSYRSIRSATKALTAAGFDTVGAALDAMGLERIAPVATIVGDIIEWPSENNLAALGVVMGNGRMLAYHPDAAGAVIVQPVEFVAAWRVEPR
ncbi:hypothetical protein BRX36_19880 [Sphingomonas sp. S-NIH.Pt1_0416]|uniref:DUF6950 family protein n=1 Tax=Sphingomonas sp. S-NIH.Pt1_0416 TaxID=1920123 RepID=UPI000F7DE110|nr:hypothetical protein [Sphingomonas sp. S-NIH.Pt1_0416]RSU58927.1 hypothetical protein BRX36_19880 [Sphingomonas sp. S-NIH.Pt1_0416]